jgi:hypothetical protein
MVSKKRQWQLLTTKKKRVSLPQNGPKKTTMTTPHQNKRCHNVNFFDKNDDGNPLPPQNVAYLKKWLLSKKRTTMTTLYSTKKTYLTTHQTIKFKKNDDGR